MEKEAEHLLADEGGSQDGYHFADQLPYRRRSGLHSRLRDIPWKALLGSFLFTVFSLSAAMLVLRMTFGYEIIIRERTFSKDVDLMLYCRSSVSECRFMGLIGCSSAALPTTIRNCTVV